MALADGGATAFIWLLLCAHTVAADSEIGTEFQERKTLGILAIVFVTLTILVADLTIRSFGRRLGNNADQ